MGKANKIFWILGLILMGTAPGGASAEEKGQRVQKLTGFPETLSKDCRDGRAKLYDECSDQLAIYAAAAKRAAAENKILLVSYGAEWCIWCHVFKAYVHGGKTKFTYTYATPDAIDEKSTATLYERERSDVSAKAEALRRFVAENFVIVHIEAQYAPNGEAVLKRTGADKHYTRGLPYIFTVSSDARFAAKFNPSLVETRRDTDDWYRGYDRGKLLALLSDMRKAALGQTSR